MNFAFLILGDFDPQRDHAEFPEGTARFVGVRNLEEACAAAKRLLEEGIGCIELCGAFGEEGARAVIRAVGNRIPVGYVIHLPEQDGLYAAVFGKNNGKA